MKRRVRLGPQRKQAGVDLHVHSTYSDGLLTPPQLCGMAARNGIRYIALCDHDTTAGLAPMREAVHALNASQPTGAHENEPEGTAAIAASTPSVAPMPSTAPITFLPGVELSTGDGGTTHILGYGVHEESQPLQKALDAVLQQRRERFEAMLDRLAHLKIEIPPTLLKTSMHQVPGRAHIARALVQLHVVNTISQAFERYLGEGKMAYVAYRHMSSAEGIRLLRSAGAVPVLAHPCRLTAKGQARMMLMEALQNEGLMGIEVFHPSASRKDVRELEAFARRHGLLVTGGSDFHGDAGSRAAMGKMPPGWTHMLQDVVLLEESITAMHP